MCGDGAGADRGRPLMTGACGPTVARSEGASAALLLGPVVACS